MARSLTPEEVNRIQKEYNSTFDRVAKAFLGKMSEMTPSHHPAIKEEYLAILEKEFGNLSQLMSSHLSLITNARKVNDGEPPITIRRYKQ